MISMLLSSSSKGIATFRPLEIYVLQGKPITYWLYTLSLDYYYTSVVVVSSSTLTKNKCVHSYLHHLFL